VKGIVPMIVVNWGCLSWLHCWLLDCWRRIHDKCCTLVESSLLWAVFLGPYPAYEAYRVGGFYRVTIEISLTIAMPVPSLAGLPCWSTSQYGRSGESLQ